MSYSHIDQLKVPASIWSTSISALLVGLLSILFIFHETAWSLVAMWYQSETYAHGFLVLPAAAYLMWLRRRIILALHPTPDYRAAIVLVILAIGWLLGALANVVVV